MNKKQLNVYDVIGYNELTGEFDYGNLDIAKEFFEKFISGDMSVINSNYLGLCANLSHYSGRTFRSYSFIPNQCGDWVDYSGDQINPVGYLSGCLNYYDGLYLQYRLSLAKHLLGKLEEMINGENTTKD